MFANNERDETKGWVVGDNKGNTFLFVQCTSVMGRKCFCPCDIVNLLYFPLKEIFDYCEVAWHGCGKVNPDALESLQHRAAKLIFGNSGLDTTLELNETFGLVPWLIGVTHIVLLTRKMPSRFSSTLFE